MSDSSDNTLQTGTVILDKWVILEFLAKGGMGEVYRAHQINLKRDVAIKIISSEWLESVEDNKDELETGLQRFHNEVQAMAQVRHPNVLQIYDYGSFSLKKGEEDIPMEFIVMEYVPGGTLRSTMSEDGFYPEEELTKDWLLNYFLPVLSGVQALHEAHIIHRDLKPGNVLMDGKRPKIADFGLARSAALKPVTKSIDVKGTPAYMSLEHFMDLRRTDQRADIYSLGKILFEAIDGKMTSETMPFKIASLPDPKKPFFGRIDKIIQKATAEKKNERFSSVNDFQDAILGAIGTGPLLEPKEDSPMDGHPSVFSRPRWIWGGISVVILALLLMALWHFLEDPGKSSLTEITPSSDTAQLTPPEPSGDMGLDLSPPTSLERRIIGKDDATLYIVEADELVLPGDIAVGERHSLQIETFYMDETEVTNHQFVAFLNKALSRVRVEREVVNGDGNVWLHLGEVTKGYEPIIYLDGKFLVKDPAFHSHPVVRVTAFGAIAYAEYYGRRLPTEVEWLHALTETEELYDKPTQLQKESAESTNHMERMHDQNQIAPSTKSIQAPKSTLPVAVTAFEPNSKGIRGLEGNVNEWSIRSGVLSPQKDLEISYVVLPKAVSRHPWEGFEDLGFRTVLSVKDREMQ